MQQNFKTRQYSNKKLYNVSVSESKISQHVRFWIKKLQRVDFQIKIFTMCQKLSTKCQNELIFWIKFLRVGIRFIIIQPMRWRTKASTTCEILKQKISNVSDLASQIYEVSGFESNVYNVSAFKSKVWHRVRFKFKMLATCQMWNQNLQLVRFRMKN